MEFVKPSNQKDSKELLDSMKVKRYDFSVEKVNGPLIGVADLILNAPLDDNELAKINDEITGQASDGWDKG